MVVDNYGKNTDFLAWLWITTVRIQTSTQNIIIIIYLTANGLSPGGSGYNACT